MGPIASRLLIVTIGALALTACDRKSSSASGCLDPDGQTVVVSLVKEQLEKAARAQTGGQDAPSVSLSKIRAAVGQLGITLDGVRTSKEDPNSTKRFCVADLQIRFPSELLDEADRAREAADMNTVSDLAEDSGVERAANVFSAALEYNVQPTDDGKNVYAETESGGNLLQFAAEVLASSLLRASVEQASREQAQFAQQQTAMEQAAEQESLAADLQLAKTDNQLATQRLNAIWSSLAAGVRAQLLPAQRAWIRAKDADCRLEGASASTEATAIEAARLRCDTRMTGERAGVLQGYRSYEPEPSDTAGTTTTGGTTTMVEPEPEPQDF